MSGHKQSSCFFHPCFDDIFMEVLLTSPRNTLKRKNFGEARKVCITMSVPVLFCCASVVFFSYSGWGQSVGNEGSSRLATVSVATRTLGREIPRDFIGLPANSGILVPVVRGHGPYWEGGIASIELSAALERATEQRAVAAEKFSTLSSLVNPRLHPDAAALKQLWMRPHSGRPMLKCNPK